MMKTALIGFIAVIAMTCSMVKGQGADTVAPSRWTHGLAASFYIMRDDFFVLPVYRADKDWLHLEARYNYEDRNTFSAWFGYNFSGGNKFQYTITPMVGGIAGNTYGIAPGLELTFNFFRFEFYSESEYVFDLQSSADNFYYNWTDFSYSPLDWFWFGLSIQRTKLYQTDLEIQRGLLIGGGYRWFALSGYIYNLGWDDPYFIITLSANIPE